MTYPTLDHEIRRVTSFDGTSLAARPLGTGSAMPLVVVPAVGADLSVWRGTLRRVLAERPVVTWDLRGMHSSDAGVSDRIDSAAHAEDGVAVMAELGIERAHIASWSTGTPIALELAHRHAESVASLTLVCGAYGYPLPRLARRLDPTGFMPLAAGVAKHFPGVVGAALRHAIARPEIAGLVRQSGVVGPTADVSALVDLLKSIASCDTRRLLATFEAVTGEAVPELLSEITAPTLLIAGDRDVFTPRVLMDDMAAAIPGARLEVYDRGTHYVPLEFPGRLADDLGTLARATS